MIKNEILVCIFFFRVTEINRFLLDHEYPNISEASKVIRHVPNYDFEKLSPHMQVIWPIICQKNQLIIESNPWLATPIQNLEYKKYIIVNFFWRSTHSYCKHGNPENERNFKLQKCFLRPTPSWLPAGRSDSKLSMTASIYRNKREILCWNKREINA